MTILIDGAFGGDNPNARDNSPGHWARTKLSPDIDWKFHHIIPWDMLRDTWQALLMCQWWKETEFYMRALGVNVNAFDVQLVTIERLKSKLLTHKDREEIYSKLSWPSWNIVEGPADRDDEGGTDLDIFHYGLTNNERKRMADIHALHDAMSSFLEKFRHQDLENARIQNRYQTESQYDPHTGAPEGVIHTQLKLRHALDKMKSYRNSPLIAFREEMWTVTLKPKKSKKGNFWERKPRYIKAIGPTPSV